MKLLWKTAERFSFGESIKKAELANLYLKTSDKRDNSHKTSSRGLITVLQKEVAALLALLKVVHLLGCILM